MSLWRERRASVCVAVALACVAGLAVAGCGDDDPEGPTVTQRVTEQFGRELLEANDDVPLAGHGTVLRLLREYHDATVSDSGRAVLAVDGRRARRSPANEQSWVLNVNGIEADEAPPEYRLYEGDVVRQVADHLGVTQHTVRTQVKSVMRKLEVNTQLAAVAVYGWVLEHPLLGGDNLEAPRPRA